MTILLIPDSFKDSISSKEIISALKRGFAKIDPAIELISCVGSDGGEGFLEAVNSQIDAEVIYHDTLDPVGRPIEAKYLLDKNNKSAYIELAEASGLERLSELERNPLYTTTVGTGLQIVHAMNKGAEKIFIGLGGSSTNDGGIGMASVLGYEFLDSKGNRLLPIGNNLEKIHEIKGGFESSQVEIIGVADVRNPLIGSNGAAYTFAAQKGANENDVLHLEKGLQNLNQQVVNYLNADEWASSGSGAAGGVGFGLKVFFGATIRSGIEFLLELAKIEQLISERQVDLIITGEGRLDYQSMQGKLIDGVIKIARKNDVPVMAICGQLDLDEATYHKMGLTYATAISGPEVEVSESISNAAFYIEKIASKLLEKL